MCLLRLPLALTICALVLLSTPAGSTGLSPAPWDLVGISFPSPEFWIKLGDLNLVLTKRAAAPAFAQIWGYEGEALKGLGAVFSSPPTVRIHLISIMIQYRDTDTPETGVA